MNEAGDGTDFDAADLGGGRRLPPLLFVTSGSALAAKFDAARVERLVSALREAGHTVVDDIPAGSVAKDAALAVRARVDGVEPKGVVLLGGYDVVPAEYVDCLTPEIRLRVSPQVDFGDDFLVWSDDLYGDTNDDAFAELPVSRVPDAGDWRLLTRSLKASRPLPARSRAGIRNIHREFAHPIFERLPGHEPMETSEPYTFEQHPRYPLEVDNVYLMLHGAARDGTRYWGERRDDASHLEAMNVHMVPARAPAVVLSGACWSALTVEELAKDYSPGQHLTPRTPAASIALAFLQAGSLAFVGPTGAHVSPASRPYQYLSGVLHQDFWREIADGAAPAQALHRAKELFGNGLPHGRRKLSDVANELKALRQFTCLGLGW